METRARDRFLDPPHVAALGAICIFVLIPAVTDWSVPTWAVFLPFALSPLLYGLPHGALDHTLLGALLSDNGLSVRISTAIGIYLVPALLFASVWILAPWLAVGLFLLMTVYHWGSADVYELVRAGARSLTWRTYILLAACRGSIPILAPLVLHREEVVQVLVQVAATAGTTTQIAWYVPSSAAAAGVLAVTSTIFFIWLQPDSGRAGRAFADTILLLALFILVHPVAAVGTYFVFWHGRNHMRRAVWYYSGGEFDVLRGRSWMLDAALITTISIAGILIIGYLAAGTAATLGWYLICISVLTFPHMVVVLWMDIHERVAHPTPKTNVGIV